MNNTQKIREYLDKSSSMITARYCRENNIPTVYLSRFEKSGFLQRVAPGFYITKDGELDELYLFQSRFKKTIFSYETALYLLGVTDKIIDTVDVTVKYSYKFNEYNQKVRVHYVKNDIWPIGVIEVQTIYGNTVKSYSFERTLCDVILNKKSVEPETYVKTIREYVKYDKRNLEELYKIAMKMGIVEKVRDIMEICYD